MTFVPYPHQRLVADLLLAGKNVILQAPTGSGKTRAALMPFLESLHPESDVTGKLPPKCIYAVPMRVLAKQFEHEYKKVVTEFGLKMAHPLSVTMQTGDQQDDPQLAGNLIFATIDQVLSSFLMAPYSLSKRQGNLNAGAILSSYLVFDEFHLFDPQSTLPTTLHMLKMLKGITPFLLMTATFGSEMLQHLATELDAEIVGKSDAERAAFAQLGSQQKTRTYHAVDAVLTAEKVLEAHKGRSLVICNTVERAKAIYRDLLDKTADKVLLLHSRFLPEDRKRIEDEIREKFKKDNTDGDYIVISTQAIEVGVDITSTALHTELAPANSIVQRAGRCARYEGDKGHIYIYAKAIKKDEIVDLREDVLPYREQEAVIQATWEAFYDQHGQLLTYDDELAIINHAHQAQSETIISDLRGTNWKHKQEMYAVMRGDEGAGVSSLVRYVFAQPVTIHDNPHEVAKGPFTYPSFSLHPGTVQGLIHDWLNQRDHEMQIAFIRQNTDFEANAQANRDERYLATAVNEAEEGFMAQLLVIHPDLATYTPEMGFIANEGGTWQAHRDPSRERRDAQRKYSGYKLETYETHIRLVYEAFQQFWPEAYWVARRMEEKFEWERGNITKAAQLAVLLHDVGKLSIQWQTWAHKYQQALYDVGLITSPPDAEAVYAHTDTNPDKALLKPDDLDPYWEIERSIKPARPWHAVEGALATAPIVVASLRNADLARAVLSAIARHHTPFSDTYRAFQLRADSTAHIEATLAGINVDMSRLDGEKQAMPIGRAVNKAFAEPNEIKPYLAYLLIARALRRADAKGTADGRYE